MSEKKTQHSRLQETFETHMNEKLLSKGYQYKGGQYIRLIPDIAVIVVEAEYPRGRSNVVSIRTGITPFCSGIHKDLDLFSARITNVTAYRGGIIEPQLHKLSWDEQMHILLENFDALFEEIDAIKSVRDIYDYYSGPDYLDILDFKYLLCVQMGDWERAHYHLIREIDQEMQAVRNAIGFCDDAQEELSQAKHWAQRRVKQKVLDSLTSELLICQARLKELQDKVVFIKEKDYAPLLEEIEQNIAASRKYCEKLFAEKSIELRV